MQLHVNKATTKSVWSHDTCNKCKFTMETKMVLLSFHFDYFVKQILRNITKRYQIHWQQNCGFALPGSWIIWIKTGNFFGVFVCVQTCEYEIIKLIFCLVIEVSTIAKKCMCSEIKVAARCFACKYFNGVIKCTWSHCFCGIFTYMYLNRYTKQKILLFKVGIFDGFEYYVSFFHQV